MKWRRPARKVWIWVLLSGGVVLVGLVICAFLIHKSVLSAGHGRIFTVQNDIPHTKVAVVLGARVYKNGRLSSMLRDRVDAGITLYKNGVVEKLLMSGDNRHRNYNEVSAMRNYAIKHGVPSNDIVRDFAGFRTYDSVYRAAKLWDLHDIIIVSQRFHLPRALYIADGLNMKAIGVAAADIQYKALAFANRREIAARLVAWIDVLVGRDPYFLGPKQNLEGDEQKTRAPEESITSDTR